MNRVFLEFKDIYKRYQMGETLVNAIDGVSFQINEGEFVAIVGQSGSGKSTCMNILGCLDVPTSGKYFIEGDDVSRLSKNEQAEIRNNMIGFIFQQYYLMGKMDALHNVELPMVYSSLSAHQRKQRALASLERVGLADKVRNFPNQLSGGEQQRVSIARALVNSPKLILADEPTGALDSKTGLDVINLLIELNGEGKTIVLISHNNELAKMAGRIIRIADGRIVYDKPNAPANTGEARDAGI